MLRSAVKFLELLLHSTAKCVVVVRKVSKKTLHLHIMKSMTKIKCFFKKKKPKTNVNGFKKGD